jgi:dienelactone hydrolase
MKKHLTLAFIALSLLGGCNQKASNQEEQQTKAPQVTLKEEELVITADTVQMKNIVAYQDDSSAKKPVVLIIPEWWGMNDYIKSRAKQLAELGYIAVGVDIYGNGKQGNTPDEAQALATPFYKNPQMAKTRMDAALAKAKTLAQADTNRIAVIGYCFGGSMALNCAKMGLPVNGVVSFHGGLAGIPPSKEKTKAQILVCHGLADKFVPEKEVAAFKKQMDSAKVAYTFKEYADATHAFTNPNSTENGKKFNIPIAYNGKADTASWNDMKQFFGQIFK